MLPVDLRADVTSPHLSSRLGNKLAPVVVGLPVGVEGAVPRLWAMRRNLDSLRTSADPVVVYVATAALMASVPGRVARKVLSFLNGKATLQVKFSQETCDMYRYCTEGFISNKLYES